jgi:hypothetical protein
VTKNEIEYRIRVAVWLSRRATESIEDCPPVVTTGRDLTVAIIVRFASGIGESLHLEAFGRGNESKVGVTISATKLEIQTCFGEARFEPVLKMEFFVLATFSRNQLVRANRFNTANEYFEA